MEEGQSIQWPKVKGKGTNNDLQNTKQKCNKCDTTPDNILIRKV